MSDAAAQFVTRDVLYGDTLYTPAGPPFPADAPADILVELRRCGALPAEPAMQQTVPEGALQSPPADTDAQPETAAEAALLNDDEPVDPDTSTPPAPEAAAPSVPGQRRPRRKG